MSFTGCWLTASNTSVSNRTGAEWEMVLFKNEELINYLTALQVQIGL